MLRERLQERSGTDPVAADPFQSRYSKPHAGDFRPHVHHYQVLRVLAILVAVVGVLSALLALQLERAREFATLRAIGMTAGEIGGLVSLQNGLHGRSGWITGDADRRVAGVGVDFRHQSPGVRLESAV